MTDKEGEDNVVHLSGLSSKPIVLEKVMHVGTCAFVVVRMLFALV